MTDRPTPRQSPPSAPAAPVAVVDLSGRTVVVPDDEFAVEWQIEPPPRRAEREPQLV